MRERRVVVGGCHIKVKCCVTGWRGFSERGLWEGEDSSIIDSGEGGRLSYCHLMAGSSFRLVIL